MLVLLSIVLLTIVFAGLLFVIILFMFLLFDAFLDLPYVATQRRKIEIIMKFAQVKKGRRPRGHSGLEGETVVDLGSGDGRLLLACAKKGARAIGYEINPLLIFITLLHAKLKGLSDNIVVIRKNLWKADLEVADVIFVYAKRKTMPKFEDFVYKNAKKGTRLVVNTNPFPNKKPLKEEDKIFLYKV